MWGGEDIEELLESCSGSPNLGGGGRGESRENSSDVSSKVTARKQGT